VKRAPEAIDVGVGDCAVGVELEPQGVPDEPSCHEPTHFPRKGDQLDCSPSYDPPPHDLMGSDRFSVLPARSELFDEQPVFGGGAQWLAELSVNLISGLERGHIFAGTRNEH
jgi:hypothetical protein